MKNKEFEVVAYVDFSLGQFTNDYKYFKNNIVLNTKYSIQAEYIEDANASPDDAFASLRIEHAGKIVEICMMYGHNSEDLICLKVVLEPRNDPNPSISKYSLLMMSIIDKCGLYELTAGYSD